MGKPGALDTLGCAETQFVYIKAPARPAVDVLYSLTSCLGFSPSLHSQLQTFFFPRYCVASVAHIHLASLSEPVSLKKKRSLGLRVLYDLPLGIYILILCGPDPACSARFDIEHHATPFHLWGRPSSSTI